MIVAFAAIAAVATLTRAVSTAGQPTGRIPRRTLVLNTIGAFALGAINTLDSPSHTLLAIAGLGSFTTFSTVVAEAADLLGDGHRRNAMAYVGITLAAGIAAARLGLSIGEHL